MPSDPNISATDKPKENGSAVLGVTSSAGGQIWRSRNGNNDDVSEFIRNFGLPEIVARVLVGRGVPVEEGENYLNPTLRDLMPDPSLFRDMDKACQRIVEAVKNGQHIAVFGDYDVDGATSASLLARFFRALSVPLRVYIPDRIREGYGPNAPALLALREEGIDLIFTVDCGISAFAPLEAAAEAGLDVIVVDHHLAEPRLPVAHSVINPNRLDQDGDYGYLAAVGVTFMLIVGINRALRQDGWYDRSNIAAPDLRQWLDLVALGTICDVVPLVGLNRAFVVQGLRVMSGRGNVGLAALGDVARLDSAPGTYHAGFLLGPRVNAGGRVGQADYGTQLLSSDNADESRQLAHELDRLNKERQDIERAVLEQAIEQVEQRGDNDTGIIFASSQGWHPGVIGIVASRLKDRFRRPAFVISLDDQNELGKASGRSVVGVDLGAIVTAARQNGLLVNGGGHAMAAGLTVEADRLNELIDFMQDALAHQTDGNAPEARLGIDGLVSVKGVTVDLVELLEQAGPFGAGNPEPRFALASVRAVKSNVVGENHVSCVLTGADGGRLKAIAFRSADGPLGDLILNSRGSAMHLAGRLRINEWQGRRTAEFHIDDGAVAT